MLTSGAGIVCADFSENYAFVVQDAAQSFHWNNCQATVHPFVIYYSDLSSIRHINFVVISDCLHHDTIAVYLFNLITFLKQRLPIFLTKVLYFSDGAVQSAVHSTKIVKISPIYVIINQISE